MTRQHVGRATEAQKLMYLAPCPADATPAQVTPKWAEHLRGIMALEQVGPIVTRYEITQLFSPADDPTLPGALFGPGLISDAWGCVGQAWLTGGMEALGELAALPEVIEARSHEAEILGSSIENSFLFQDELIYDRGDTNIKIFSWLKRQPNLTLDEFADQWRDFIDLFLTHDELVSRSQMYIQSHVFDPTGAGDARFDGVAIMGFSSVEQMLDFMGQPSLVEELFPAEAPWLDRTQGVVVVGRPEVLKG
ncbi:unannotated protein [freshwater metagenome]|uniref:Unannotated protein n=1 Tax=freshwater metagenome TaxID=449393 RepID=A0A6J7JFT9_9ZZZZ|nr:hypothetical protein [Actinomycetota bacterium]